MSNIIAPDLCNVIWDKHLVGEKSYNIKGKNCLLITDPVFHMVVIVLVVISFSKVILVRRLIFR